MGPPDAERRQSLGQLQVCSILARRGARQAGEAGRGNSIFENYDIEMKKDFTKTIYLATRYEFLNAIT